MTKKQFLKQLNKKLWALPKTEREERLNFYDEIIEDKIEEGLTEEDAVGEIGDIDEIANQILSENDICNSNNRISKKVKELKSEHIILLILGFPIWFPLIISIVVVVLSVYLSLWSIIISLWAVFGSVCLCAPTILIVGIFNFGSVPYALLACVGLSLACVGLSVILYYACKVATTGIVSLTKQIVNYLKNKIAGAKNNA